MYLVLKGFSNNNISATKGKTIEIKDKKLVSALLKAGYISNYSEKELSARESKKEIQNLTNTLAEKEAEIESLNQKIAELEAQLEEKNVDDDEVDDGEDTPDSEEDEKEDEKIEEDKKTSSE